MRPPCRRAPSDPGLEAREQASCVEQEATVMDRARAHDEFKVRLMGGKFNAFATTGSRNTMEAEVPVVLA